MNASCNDQPRTRPVAFRTNSERSSYGGSPAIVAMQLPSLSASEQEPLDLLLAVQVHDRSEQIALLVRAAGINAERSADTAVAPRLVDVAVQRERRLMLLDRLAHRRRADRLH